jgi:hypothetical protein
MANTSKEEDFMSVSSGDDLGIDDLDIVVYGSRCGQPSRCRFHNHL